MIYAKQMKNGAFIALITYDYIPEVGEESGTVIITEEEYRELLSEMQKDRPEPDPDELSNAEALRIITGEEDITNEEV